MLAKLLRGIIPKRFRPIGYLEHLVRTRTGGRVASGPFMGMRVLEDSVGSALIPKMLGIYERELHPRIEDACREKFPLIVDIGAAEGYYAVGMALRNPTAKIVAFELEEKGRRLLAEMCKANATEGQVEIHGRCEPSDLTTLLPGHERALIICDVEGYEEKLLDPEQAPELARCHILVEMHDFIIPDITAKLMARLSASHQIEEIWQEPRVRADLPFRSWGTRLLPARYLDWAVSEWRPVRMSWLWAKPHAT